MRTIAPLALLLLAAPLQAQQPACVYAGTERPRDIESSGVYPGRTVSRYPFRNMLVSVLCPAGTQPDAPAITGLIDSLTRTQTALVLSERLLIQRIQRLPDNSPALKQIVDSIAKAHAPAPPRPVPVAATPAGTAPPSPAPAPGVYRNWPQNYTRIIADLDLGPNLKPGPCTGRPNGDERFIDGLNMTWSTIFDCWAPGQPSHWTPVVEDGRTAWRLLYPIGDPSQPLGAGNLGRPLPNLKEVFIAYWVKWDRAFEFHSISTKHIRLQKSNGNFLVQASHNRDFLRASDEGIGQAYEPQNGSMPTLGTWHLVEVLIRVGSPGTVRIWLDGQLRTNYTSLPVTGPFQTISFDGHLGGGASRKTRESWIWYDRIFVATTP